MLTLRFPTPWQFLGAQKTPQHSSQIPLGRSCLRLKRARENHPGPEQNHRQAQDRRLCDNANSFLKTRI